MKRIFLIAVALLFFSLGSAHAYTDVSFSIGFHDTLSPYGTWVHVSRYGDVWRPRVAAAWRPFTNGHWVYTNSGPYWDGYEPYAWVVYHYGHWVWLEGYGWAWVPGYQYDAAPVSWAYGDSYIGWSPISGYTGFNANFWIFVDRSHFRYRNYAGYYLSATRIRPLFQRRAIRVVSRPLAIRTVERITRHRISVVPVRQRVVNLNGHRTVLIVPKDRERTVLNHVAEAARKTKTRTVELSKTRTVHTRQAEIKRPIHENGRLARGTSKPGRAAEHETITQKRSYTTKPSIHTAKRTERPKNSHLAALKSGQSRNVGGAGSSGHVEKAAHATSSAHSRSNAHVKTTSHSNDRHAVSPKTARAKIQQTQKHAQGTKRTKEKPHPYHSHS
jgi:hypothetical protein